MRTYDFAPLYRSTVGFDRMFSILDQLGGGEGSVPSYPPYNIERNGENAFRISVAVAGFTDADLSIEAKENTLTIRGRTIGMSAASRGGGFTPAGLSLAAHRPMVGPTNDIQIYGRYFFSLPGGDNPPRA